ncbi:MAG: SMC family ATPase, partial [Bacteroidota bacterium]|nr:SMC family ATPase [Bacteroidota bacterium]
MIITAIRLRNIKSFVEEELQFTRGINIIAGRNGAGKSTIIESVGLALFDAWPQRFKDGNARSGFLRHGTRDGTIEVDVMHEGRAFTVRCELAQRKKAGKISIDYERVLRAADGEERANSAGRKKEFQEDLRHALLGEARIDDEKLFRDIIGTEQGAFDEPFTRTEAERRALFEKILGIEDFQDFDRQFWHYVKWQSSRAKELAIRLDAQGGVPDELAAAEALLAVREAAATTAATTLTDVEKRSTAARQAFDALSSRRDALRDAEAELLRVREQRNGAETTAATARRLRDEAAAAVRELEDARAGHDAYLATETRLGELRAAAKQRESAERALAAETARVDKAQTERITRRAALEEERARLADEIGKAEKRKAEMKLRITEMRVEYRALESARQVAAARLAAAGELRAFVQDLRTTRQTLRNAGETVHQLRDTLAALRETLERTRLETPFLPELQEETDGLYRRYGSQEGAAEEDATVDRMFTAAQRMEQECKTKTDAAADAASRMAQEGKTGAAALMEREKDYELLEKRQENAVVALETLVAEIATEEERWTTRAGDLRAALAAHGDVDAMIAEQESLRERHRLAHEVFMARQDAARSLAAREDALRAADDALRASRIAVEKQERKVGTLAEGFSEEEHTAARVALDAALEAATDAKAAHSEAAALAAEQRGRVKELRKEFREFEHLRVAAARARSEAAFSTDVHQHVVRELARRVGSSIVSALSSFAADLYARIAPEQDLTLYWDPDTYAVELRGPQGTVRGRELSGGQLMGVSLAVKLALIKWYSQCRVGFLDEPTTHLDRETRRHLAEVFQNLEQLTTDGDPWFDQLFVISHEESFSGAGHRIELERSGT